MAAAVTPRIMQLSTQMRAVLLENYPISQSSLGVTKLDYDRVPHELQNQFCQVAWFCFFFLVELFAHPGSLRLSLS